MADIPEQSGIIAPENCKTMVDVRKGVDATDRALVALLVCRFGYMDAAARIKQRRDAVRDEERKAQVIANVRAEAAKFDLPADLLTQIWDDLIEGSIAYEMQRWDEKHG